MTAPATETWTTRKLLAWMNKAFVTKGLDQPRLLSEMLMAHVVGCERLRLYTDADRPASPMERDMLRDLVGRALKHEPVQYLVGSGWFFGLEFKTDRRALIPRPSTETIIEHVLQHHRASHGPSNQTGEGLLIADVCTGSGVIAVTLAKRLPLARLVATDLSPDAVGLAKENAARHAVADRVTFLTGDLLRALAEFPATAGEHSLDYLVSNPPYIPDNEWDAVEPNVKEHEPHLALRGGADGLDLARRLLADGPKLLKPGGVLLIEVADASAEKASAIAAAHPLLTDVKILRDFENLKRVIVGVAPRARG